MAQHVVVIGAGIVGAATAWELVKTGHRVTIVEPDEPGGRQAASYGNGAWISPASVVPMSMPGLWRKIPGMLLDPTGPLTLRWSAIPTLAPWLLRFLAAGATVDRVERTARALSSVLSDAPKRHLALAEEIGRPELVRQAGLIYAYPNREAFAAEALAWRLRKDNGLVWQELDAEALQRREPDLNRSYQFAVLVAAGAHCLDPGGFVAALAAAAVGRGAMLKRSRATGFEIENGRLTAVTTETGALPCDKAVICAGIHSRALARAAGDRIFLESERGYHAVIANPAAGPRRPLMPSDGRQGNTPTAAGLRLSGQVELAQLDAAPNWKRVEVLVDHAVGAYPGLGPRSTLQIDRWMGHRPSTPDGKPVIGLAKRSGDIVHAFGHGHVGLASGPITGRIAADLATGGKPPIDIAPFDPKRFS